MSKGIVSMISGGLEIAAGILVAVGTLGGGTPLAAMLITAGAGQLISGIGTLLSKGSLKTGSTTERNPVNPWEVIYGQARVGGTVNYIHQWGDGNKFVDMVITAACHPCQSIDALYFDNQRVQIDSTQGLCSTSGTSVTWVAGANEFFRYSLANFADPPLYSGGFESGQLIRINGQIYTIANWNSTTSLTLTESAGTQSDVSYTGGGTCPAGAIPESGVSFKPENGGRTPTNIAAISRSAPPNGGVVTVTLVSDIPYLQDGDWISITDTDGDSNSLANYGAVGKFQVTIISRVAGSSITFYYVSSGDAFNITNEGQAWTNFANYYRSIYFEPLLGTQTLGETFKGMIIGTELGGVGSDQALYPYQYNDSTSSNVNPWTANCSGVGMTAFHLRILYSPLVYPAGIPQISVQVSGKNDILDPRNSPPTYGYTTNAALCIADYLNQGDTTDGRNRIKWGYAAPYGTDIPTAELIAAANICDEQVGLSIPYTSPLTTESRYTCNGHFNLAMKRREILSNLLTSCAGRITDSTPFIIYPAAWPGVSLTFSSAWMDTNASGPRKWRPSVTISSLFNGVKGTYISPTNQWKPSDFPRYAQDADHGYNDGPSEYNYDLNLANDGGDRRWLDIQLPFTNSAATAQRIAKIELMRRRQQGTGTFMLNMAGYQIAPADVLAVSLSYFGWDGQYLEVLAARLKFDRVALESSGEVILLGTEIDVQETDPSVYDWELIEQLSPQGYQQPGIPDGVDTPDPPSNLKFSYDESGDTILTWTPPIDPYVAYIKGRYMLVISPPGLWISLGTYDVTVTQLTMPSLLPGQLYLVELEAINSAGVQSPWASIDYTPLSLPPQWNPYEVQADSGDALYPDEWSFGLALSYVNLLGAQNALADGTQLARVNITGAQPINQTISGCPAPVIAATSVTSGGNLPGGTTIFVSVTADDGEGNFSPPASIVQVNIPDGGDTNAIDLTVTWPDYAGFVHYDIFAAELVDLICAQEDGALAAGYLSPPTSPATIVYSPGTVTLGGTLTSPPGPGLQRSTWGLPNSTVRKVRIKAAVLYHGGVLGAGVSSVSGNVIIADDCVGSGSDNWADRVLCIIGRDNTSTFPAETVPFAAYDISSFDSTTGAFTLGRSAVYSTPGEEYPQVGFTQLGTAQPMGGDSSTTSAQEAAALNNIQPGDAFVVCTKGYDNSADQYQLQDSGWLNHVENDDMGLTPKIEQGMVAWVIKGKSRGMKAVVGTNSNDTHFLLTPLPIDETSVWVIVEAGYAYSVDGVGLTASNPSVPTTTVLPVSNFYQQSMLAVPVLVDVAGQESEIGDGQVRMFYTYGTLIQNFGTPYTFGVTSSLVGYAVTLPLPIKAAGTAFDVTIQIQDSPSEDTAIDINIVTPGSPPTSTSIFSGASFTIPAGSVGSVIGNTTAFASTPLNLPVGDSLTIDILSGAADGTFTVVLRWIAS
jgi:hypothetical protein